MKSSDAHCGRLSGQVPVCLASLEGIGGGRGERRDPSIAQEPAGDVGQEAIRQGHRPSQLLGHLPGDGENKVDNHPGGGGGGERRPAPSSNQTPATQMHPPCRAPEPSGHWEGTSPLPLPSSEDQISQPRPEHVPWPPGLQPSGRSRSFLPLWSAASPEKCHLQVTVTTGARGAGKPRAPVGQRQSFSRAGQPPSLHERTIKSQR